MADAPPQFSYEIYIAAPAARVWNALVDGEMTRKYVYGTRLRSSLKRGSRYAYLGEGDFEAVTGEILEVEPERRLVMSWEAHWDADVSKDRASRVSYELAQVNPRTTRLALRHHGFEGRTPTYTGSIDAWPMLLSSLKSLVETGRPLEMADGGSGG
jgi:uncharacterized protein YndB with AHSA1/START domain